MKKLVLIGGAFFGALVAIFFVTNGADYNPLDFWQWLISLGAGAAGSVTSAGEAILGTGDALTLATNLVMGYEGFRAKAYTDATGNLTIGYGHEVVDGDGYTADSTISQADAQTLLASDLQTFQQCVESAISQPMTPGQEASMISLCYNIGCDAFSSSTLVSDFNSGDVDGASAQFLSWDKGHVSGVLTVIAGLASRRASEQSVFNAASATTDASNTSSDDSTDDGSDDGEDNG